MKVEEELLSDTISQIMLNRFLDAVKGDVIKYADMNNDTHYVILASRNVPEKGINQKVYTLYNLKTGYVWRDGGTSLQEAFKEYFTDSNGIVRIKDLKVFHNSRLLVK